MRRRRKGSGYLSVWRMTATMLLADHKCALIARGLDATNVDTEAAIGFPLVRVAALVGVHRPGPVINLETEEQSTSNTRLKLPQYVSHSKRPSEYKDILSATANSNLQIYGKRVPIGIHNLAWVPSSTCTLPVTFTCRLTLAINMLHSCNQASSMPLHHPSITLRAQRLCRIHPQSYVNVRVCRRSPLTCIALSPATRRLSAEAARTRNPQSAITCIQQNLPSVAAVLAPDAAHSGSSVWLVSLRLRRLCLKRLQQSIRKSPQRQCRLYPAAKIADRSWRLDDKHGDMVCDRLKAPYSFTLHYYKRANNQFIV